jgi:hypothetical protein
MAVYELAGTSGGADRPGPVPDPRAAPGALGRLADLAQRWDESRSGAILEPGVARGTDDDYNRARAIALHPAGSGLRADDCGCDSSSHIGFW